MTRTSACIAAVLATAVVGLVTGCGLRPTPPTGLPGTTPSGSGVPATASTGPSGGLPSSPPPSSPPSTGTPGQPPPPKGTGALRLGATGPAVLALQQRLQALGYWLGAVDGAYGASTLHAVVAFQKASGLRRDGIAGPVTLATLENASRPVPRSRSGRLIEIDLHRQLLFVVIDGRVRWTLDTSTGAVPGTTPVGHFTIYRQVDGYHRAPLGVLYRPKYFSGGVAVHGFPHVPAYPASHGCVRVTNAEMDLLWANHLLPMGSPVWVY